MEKTMILDAKIENLYPLLETINQELETLQCDSAIISTVDICVEEVFVNIASYSYGEEEGQAEITMHIDEKEVELVFKDSGIPYDPLKKEDPDIALGAMERQIGGLGIFLVKEMMDFVEYEYKEKKNCLRLRKAIKAVKEIE